LAITVRTIAARHDAMILAAASIARVRRVLTGALVALSATALAGCGTISDDTASSAMVAPGKYDIYTCRDIARQTRAMRVRLTELEQLMARAEQGAGGTLVNAIAYRSEYLQTRGELDQLAKAANSKQCPIQSQWSSGRVIF
jgi:hypothetical protein